MGIAGIVFVLTAINFIFQADFIILMPLGQSVMDHFRISTAEYASVVGVYSLASGITSLLFSFFGGAFRKKTVMLISIFFLGLSCFATGMANSFGQLFLIRFIAGCWGGILNPLIFSIASDAIPAESRGRSMGWIMTGFSLASVIGVPLGIWVMDTYSFSATFYTFGAGFIVIFALSLFILPIDTVNHRQHRLKDLLNEFSDSLKRIEYVQGYTLLFFITGAIFIVVPLISPFAIKNLGMNNSNLQQMYLFGGVLTFVSSRLLGGLCDRWGLKSTLNFTIFFSIIPVLLFVGLDSSSELVFISLGSLMMASMSGMMVPAMTIASLIPSPDNRSAFNGILNSIRNISSSIFTYLAGVIVIMNKEGDRFINFDLLGIFYILLISYIFLTGFLISGFHKRTATS